MNLSSVHNNKLWILVYHIDMSSEVVELITNQVFDSAHLALKWLITEDNPGNYIQPEAVLLSDLTQIELRPSDKRKGLDC